MDKNKKFMEKVAEGIVNGRWVILALTLALIVFSCFSVGWIRVENDITYYLQDSAEAKQGLVKMNEEFITYATASAMVENIPFEDAQALRDEIAAMDGVTMVEFDASEKHYKENAALFNVTFSTVGEDERAVQAMSELKALLAPYETQIYSESFDTLSNIIVTEMLGVLVIVVIVVIAVLIFTSSTYGEILVLLATFVVAAVINMGTNFLLGTISFVSNAVSIVLQLALSVDYAIILCNRYKEEHQLLPVREAVISALSKSIPSISASSLTTIAGLTAMTFMKFKLGLDMGIALIKSIVFSLISVFLFMPAMLMFCGGLMDRTKHKSFVPKVSFLGKFAYATRYIVPPLFVILVIVSFIGFNHSYYGYAMDSTENNHKNEQDLALEAIEDRFGKNNLLVVLLPAGDYEKEAAFSEELSACREIKSVLGLASIDAIRGYKLADSVNYEGIMELADIDETMAKALLSYCAADRDEYYEVSENLDGYTIPIIDMFLSLREAAGSGAVELTQEQSELIDSLYSQLKMAQDQLQGENYSRIITYIDLPNQGDETFAFLDRVHKMAEKYYPEGVILTGNPVAAKDFNESFVSDNRIVSILSIVLVMLILFFTFKSVGMPILLILVIQGSIWLNFAIPAWRGEYVFFMCFLIVTAIQMGANIDYAIVISGRYSELRERDVPQKEAIIETLNLAFPTVITSGLMMVVAGLLIGARVSQCVIAGMGKYVGTGTSISLLLVNLVLPQILIFGDSFARATTFKGSGKLMAAENAPLRRQALAYALTLAVLFSLAAAPVNMSRTGAKMRAEKYRNSVLLSRAEEMQDILRELDHIEGGETDVKMDFAEHLMTDTVGTQQLNDGLAEYAEGEATLEEYKKLLDDGEEQYRAGYEEYLKGLEELEAGKEKLAEGQAEYDAGLAEYEEGKAQLAEGQAEYDAGLAAYEEGKATLLQGQLLLATVQPIYDAAMPLYNRYLALQARYDELSASGEASRLELALLRGELESARILFETSLGGYSMSSLLSSIEDAQRQVEEGKAQLAEAEEQLAAGKAELDEGYAQLADAEAQLAAGKAELDAGYAELAAGQKKLDDGWAELQAARAELDDGAKQIKDGEDELHAAEQQIEDGKATLEDNKAKLQEDFDTLDRLSDDKEKLKAGIKLLRGTEAVAHSAGSGATDAEVCTAAEQYFEAQLRTLEQEGRTLHIVTALFVSAALAAGAALLLWLGRRVRPASVFALVSALAALGAAILGRVGCGVYGRFLFWAALALMLLSAVAAELLSRLAREKATA